MLDIAPAPWTPGDRELWRRIAAHPFEDADRALDFTGRLARDRGWTRAFARGAIEEYRRFCFLAMTRAEPVTPSEEVDEIWHQHLAYSRDYWEAWCARALGAPLHHDPTAGGPVEGTRYRAQYAETLAAYESRFGSPDPAYWPSTRKRFRGRPRFGVLDRDRWLAVPHPRRLAYAAVTLVAALGTSRAAAAGAPLPTNPLDWPATPFLQLYGTLVALTVAGVLLASWRVRASGLGVATRPAPERVEVAFNDLDLLALARLAGGRARVAEAALVALVDTDAARIDVVEGLFAGRRADILWGDPDSGLDANLVAFRDRLPPRQRLADFRRTTRTLTEALEVEFARRGLVPDPSRVARARAVMAVGVAGVVGFGLAKVAVGASRGKPVGYLLALVALAVIGSVVAASVVPLRTPFGGAVLRRCRDRFRRAAQSPRAAEVAFAFALGGAAALSGTHLHAVGVLLRAGDGGLPSGGGGGGGDGGGGGGGCGGCGGGT